MIKTIAFMPRRTDTTRAQFRHYYETRHAPLATPLFPFTRYRRNHLADQDFEPGFDCVSEFWISSLERVGELMEGEAGDTMRADERNFLDQPAIVAVLSDVTLTDGDSGDTLLLLNHRCGNRDALIAACREATANLEFLSPLDERPPPFDAMVRFSDTAPQLPDGWTLGLTFQIERCETDRAELMGARS